MHVLICSDDPGIGGVAQFDHNFSLGLRKAGFRASLVATRYHNPQVEERERQGVEHHWLDYNTVSEFARTINRVDEPQALLQTLRPDVILFSDSCPVSNFGAKRAAQALGIPYLARVGFVAPYLAERFAVLLPRLGELYAQARAVVAVSRENLMLMERLFRLPPERGRVIYSGKGESFFRAPDPEVRHRLRARLGVPDDGVLCFTAARLETVKGYQYQMAAIEAMRAAPVWQRLYFAWAGPGKMEEELRRQIAERGLCGRVHLLGQCWDVPDWLDAADLFVLPAQAEGLPQAVMEAMAKRLPVISTRVSGIPEALGDTGVLLPDPAADPKGVIAGLARVIPELAAADGRRRAMGEACYQRADRMFRAERMVADYIALLTGPVAPVAAASLPALLARHALPAPPRAFRPRLCGEPEEAVAGLLAGLWQRYRDELAELADDCAARRDQARAAGPAPGLPALEGELIYVLVRELKPELVYEIGCGAGRASSYILAALARNGSGRAELFEAAETIAGLPAETALRVGLAAGADAGRHRLTLGDPRVSVLARLDKETPGLTVVAPSADEAFAEWLVKGLLGRIAGPVLFSGLLAGGLEPEPGATYLLSYLQHLGAEPLAFGLYQDRLGRDGGRTGERSGALLLDAGARRSPPGDAAAGLFARVLAAADAADPRFPLTSQQRWPDYLGLHRWGKAMPPEDRCPAALHAGIIDRNRLGLAELLRLWQRSRSGPGSLPALALEDLAKRFASTDPFAAVLILETVLAAGATPLARQMLAVIGGQAVRGPVLPLRVARVAEALGLPAEAAAWGERARLATSGS